VESSDSLAAEMPTRMKPHLLYWFKTKGVVTLTEAKCEEITDKGVTVVTKEGKRETIEADSVIPAMPLAPNTGLLKSLEGKVPEIHAIGDCGNPRLIVDAIADGWKIGNAL
jgi:2,4-dienoyl-CoA reductase (NADPH2)